MEVSGEYGSFLACEHSNSATWCDLSECSIYKAGGYDATVWVRGFWFGLKDVNFSSCELDNSSVLDLEHFADFYGPDGPDTYSSYVTCYKCSGEFGFKYSPYDILHEFFIHVNNHGSVAWYCFDAGFLMLKNSLFVGHTGNLFGSHVSLGIIECQFSGDQLP
jgi:hypothetical protein